MGPLYICFLRASEIQFLTHFFPNFINTKYYFFTVLRIKKKHDKIVIELPKKLQEEPTSYVKDNIYESISYEYPSVVIKDSSAKFNRPLPQLPEGLVSSDNYIISHKVDNASDKNHPTKKQSPPVMGAYVPMKYL